MIRGTSVLTITNEMSYLPAIQVFAREVARETGFADDDVEMILLALEEAVVNVIEHAFGADEQSTFQVIFEPGSTGITITVKDKGLPYDPEILPEYGEPHDSENVPPHGLGSLIMKKCVDRVVFHNLGKEGKELRLAKYLPLKNIAEYDEDALPEATCALKKDAAPSVPHRIEVRLMRPDEALEVSRLFYRTYGYSYFSDVMYYPDRLAARNEEGLITSVVAVSEENEIVGHVAILKDAVTDTIAEAGRGAVKSSFRGLDIFGSMEKFLVDRARDMGLRGIYGKAVTVHTYSQRMTAKTGHKDCAVLVGCAPADVSFKGIAEKPPQRGTYVYSFLALAPLQAATIYPPPHHEPFIRKIYSHLGLMRDFKIASQERAENELSVIESKIMPEDNTAEIVLSHYGRDSAAALRHLLRQLCVGKKEQITLFLNLGDPLTSRMCSEFEKLGFFISGIIPVLHFEDTLILQYLNGIALDYSQIQIFSDFTKDVLAYIRDRDPSNVL